MPLATLSLWLKQIPAMRQKYSNDYYHISTITPQDSSVTLENADTHYQMNLYYEPEKTTYKVLYYQETEDGNYKLLNEYVSPPTYIGKTVYAEIKTPNGYIEGGDYTATFGIVKPNNATILKVYYDKYIPSRNQPRWDRHHHHHQARLQLLHRLLHQLLHRLPHQPLRRLSLQRAGNGDSDDDTNHSTNDCSNSGSNLPRQP